jgi:RNA chaperone Hfq
LAYLSIPKLKGKKVIIRLVSGGQPVTGTLEGYNPYEILIQTVKGQTLVFKHAIAVIEPVDMPKQELNDMPPQSPRDRIL